MPNDKVVQDGCLLGRAWARSGARAMVTAVQKRLWQSPPKWDGIRRWGWVRLLLLPHPSLCWVPCWGVSAAAPLFSSCLILFSKSVIKTDHVMDALCYLKALKSIAEVIKRNSLSSQSYLRQHRYFECCKAWQASSQTNGGKHDKPFCCPGCRHHTFVQISRLKFSLVSSALCVFFF